MFKVVKSRHLCSVVSRFALNDKEVQIRWEMASVLLLVFLFAVATCSLQPQPLITEIDVCQGRDYVCLNETVFQQCVLSNNTLIVYGNPELCPDGFVCDMSDQQEVCVKLEPFKCTSTGYFRDPPGCKRYHVCQVFSNKVIDTLMTCPGQLEFSSAKKLCVDPSISDCSQWNN